VHARRQVELEEHSRMKTKDRQREGERAKLYANLRFVFFAEASLGSMEFNPKIPNESEEF